MNPRVTVGMLVVLLALGAYYFFGAPAPSATGPTGPAGAPGIPTPKPEDPSLEFWALEENQIQSIAVQRGSQTAGVQRTGDDWILTPSGEPADRLRVSSLIFRLATVKATYKVTGTPNEQEIGLANPAMIATIQMANGEGHVLMIGGKAPAEAGTYVRKDTDASVYLISNALATDLERIVTEPPRPPSPTPLPGASPSPSP